MKSRQVLLGRVFLGGVVGIAILARVAFAHAKEVEISALTRYDQLMVRLNKIAADHPKTARIFSLGNSDTGEEIKGVAIGSGAVNDLVVATHHGNEYGSTEVAMAFASAIAEKPISSLTVFVIPVLNVSGYNSSTRWERGLDPNRDYPGPCGTEGPFKLKDTAALASFIDQKQIVVSATLHTYYPAVVYPWGIPTQQLSTPYEDGFKKLVTMAALESGYRTGNSTEVIYPAVGTFEDYAFWKHGIWSILFELGYSHVPSDTDVLEMNRVNVPGLVRMLENAPRIRAQNHGFQGACDRQMRGWDRHDE